MRLRLTGPRRNKYSYVDKNKLTVIQHLSTKDQEVPVIIKLKKWYNPVSWKLYKEYKKNPPTAIWIRKTKSITYSISISTKIEIIWTTLSYRGRTKMVEEVTLNI